MSESLAGFTSAVTRQNAGTSLNGAMPAAPPGSAKAPSATAWADVIVVSGSLRPLRLSHEAGFSAAHTRVAKTRTSKPENRTFKAFHKICGLKSFLTAQPPIRDG